MPLIYPPHDPRRTDSRLYKGGDGGSGEMRRMEDERQRKVQSAVDAINAQFGYGREVGPAAPTRDQFPGNLSDVAENLAQQMSPGSKGGDALYQQAVADWQAARERNAAAQPARAGREAMYSDIAAAVRDTAMRDLDRQYSKASQRNKFGLARSGLLGSSMDAEAGGELQEMYGEGKLKATQAGQQAGSDLRVQDERMRQNLISLAQSGLDTGTASSMAAGQMASAADLARSGTATASVGRVFDDMSQAYVTNQVMKTRYPNGMPGQQQQPAGYSTGVFNPRRYVGNEQR